MKKLKIWVGVAVLACGFGAARAFANESEGGACREDAKRLCGEVKPGSGAIHDCMKAHEAELSAECKEKMSHHKKNFAEKKKKIEAACGADIKQYCANVTPGEGREFACLKAYDDKLSAGCKEAMQKARDYRKKHKDGDKHKGHDHDHDEDDKKKS